MKKKNSVAIAENQERINELENDIKEIKSTIADPDIPEETKTELKESLSDMQAELQSLIEENEKKIKNEKKKEEKPKIMVDGKSYDELSPEELESSWNARADKASKLSGFSKTKSVVERV